jgi:hypothetical protein
MLEILIAAFAYQFPALAALAVVALRTYAHTACMIIGLTMS